jgi:uncharacterized protein (TIGR00369 family)
MTSLPPTPFVDHVNIKNHGGEDSIAVSEVAPLHHHMNRIESAHGGLIATLLDNAMVSAGRAAAGPNARLATIEMKVSFMRAGKGTLRCTARRLHSTSKLAFCEGEVRDAAEKLTATASSTMQYVIRSGGKTPPSTTPA